MTLALYGGAFNPPHRGHIALAKAAVDHLRPDRFLWMPSGDPPHKQFPPGSPTAEQRIAMTQRAAAVVPGSECASLEIERGLRYTADTLALLHTALQPRKLWFLVGGDMLLSLGSWYKPEQILSLCSIAAFARNAEEFSALEAEALRLRQRFGGELRVFRHPPLPLSSTELRAWIPLGRGAEGLSPAVYDYICTERLYAVPAAESLALPLLRRNVSERLSPRRARHSFGVAECAVALAKCHGVPEEKAAQAALLHDLTKEEANQLKLLESCDILPESYVALPDLHHALSAAAMARRRGACPDVVNAVRYHCTGRPGMSALEAIVFLSDKTEANRPSYPGLEEIRAASRKDLRAAMLLALQCAESYLRSRTKEPAALSVETAAWLRENPDCFVKPGKEPMDEQQRKTR